MTTNERFKDYLYIQNKIIAFFNSFSYQAQLNTHRGGGDGIKQYRHNQQLEELRNLQDKLSGEKAAWAASRDQEMKELEEKKAELLRLQVSAELLI